MVLGPAVGCNDTTDSEANLSIHKRDAFAYGASARTEEKRQRAC